MGKQEYNKNYIISCINSFLGGLVFYAPVSLLFRNQRGLSAAETFLTQTILLIFIFILELPAGVFTDKFGYKKTLLLSYCIAAVSKTLFYFAYGFPMFVLVSILDAGSIACASGCAESFIYESVNQDNIQKAFGHINALGTIGYIGANLFSSVLIKHSIDLAVLISIIPVIIGAVATAFLDDIYVERDKLRIHDIMMHLKQMGVILLFVISINMISETVHSLDAFLSQLLFLRVGIPVLLFGMISAVSQIMSVSSGITWRITKIIGNYKFIFFLGTIIAVGFFALVLTRSAVAVILIVIFIQAASSMMYPINEQILQHSITKNRATMLSIYSVVGSLFASAVNIVLGKIVDINLNAAMLFSGIICILSILLIFLYYIFREKKQRFRCL